MLNKVILVGKIAIEPELRFFKDGSIITILIILTKEKIKNKTQNNWHRVIINNKNKEFKKNMMVLIVGKIKTRKWLDKKNKYNYITEIITEEIKEIFNEEKMEFSKKNEYENNEKTNEYYEDTENRENDNNDNINYNTEEKNENKKKEEELYENNDEKDEKNFYYEEE